MPIPRRNYDRTLNPDLERLLYQVKVVRMEAEGLLHGLNDEQFNWQPEPGRWSMAQCFDHLNVTNGRMIGNLEASIREGRQSNRVSDGPYAYGFFGRWFLQLMQPPVKRRFKAPEVFQPAQRKTVAEIMPDWERTHDRVDELLEDSRGLDLARIKVQSPAAKWLKYSLGIGFWIQTAHDRRHLWQARQVRNSPQFPKA